VKFEHTFYNIVSTENSISIFHYERSNRISYMNPPASIDDLVQELQRLKLRERQIVELLAERGLQPTVLEQTEVAAPVTEQRRRRYIEYFKVGDRVRIVNRLYSRASTWPPPEGEEAHRNATVTKIDLKNDRVYFITDAGTKTNRLAVNLVKL
jgi:hypothetical protein